MPYYTQFGERIREPAAYADTGAPMYNNWNIENSRDINVPTYIYKLDLASGKKYIRKTLNV